MKQLLRALSHPCIARGKEKKLRAGFGGPPSRDIDPDDGEQHRARSPRGGAPSARLNPLGATVGGRRMPHLRLWFSSSEWLRRRDADPLNRFAGALHRQFSPPRPRRRNNR